MSVQDETPSQCNRFEEAAVIQSSPTLAGLERRFTIREVEHLARISHATAYDRIRRGFLRVVKDGRRTFVLRSELERYLSAES